MTTIFGERLGGLLARRAASKAGDFLVPALGQIGLSLAGTGDDDPSNLSPALAQPAAHTPASGLGTGVGATGLLPPIPSCYSPTPAAVSPAPALVAAAPPVVASVAVPTAATNHSAQPIIRETVVQQHVVHEQPISRITNVDSRVMNVDQRVQNIDNRETQVTQTILQRITANGPVNQTIGAGVVSGDGASALGPAVHGGAALPVAPAPALPATSATSDATSTATSDATSTEPAKPIDPARDAEHSLDLAFGEGAVVGDATLSTAPAQESAAPAAFRPASAEDANPAAALAHTERPAPVVYSSHDDAHFAPSEDQTDEQTDAPADQPHLERTALPDAVAAVAPHEGLLGPETDDSVYQTDPA